ncbi:MAG TPA: carbohydrate porin [Bryobacteraceae bacterium]|nr:carbohydrate porin [Bryobacteraceae bacterium]
MLLCKTRCPHRKPQSALFRAFAICTISLLTAPLFAQDPAPADSGSSPSNDAAADSEPASERWNLYYQATSIGDYHGTFHSPYEGARSLQNYPERDVSLTTTLFLTLGLEQDTFLIFNPEIAGGKGFSGVNGIANQPNGEIPRVATATPKPYLARLYIQHDFGFGEAKEHQESDANQLAGDRPVNRYSIYAGRFTLTDFFDDNNYSHDPRTQFLPWGVMYNGAWDYPADTRGYTWGLVQEVNTRNWAFRYGIVAEPKVANGQQFDRRLFRDHGQVWEVERRYAWRKRAGVVRVLAYDNREQGGNYGQALALAARTGTTPDVDLTDHVGTLKYGTGVSFDQALTDNLGMFIRLGWNDGKTQSFAFTAIDRLAGGGVSLKGTRWKRRADVVATSLTAGGLSAVHAQYLAAGGLDFLIGDGALNYAPEYVWETYYSAKVARGLYATFDVQRDTNPAYNHDRGPVMIYSIRLHLAFGLKPWQQ